ncbi:MAG TPA: ABC transporter permease, partial [Anaerolineales bacterium]
MTTYLLRRIAFLFLTLVLTSLIIFAITQLLPGDVCRVILGREVGEAALRNCREDLGLDQPAITRYFIWLGDFVRGDWGNSYSTDVEIFPLVAERLGNSLRLAALVMLIGVPLAAGFGALAALNESRWVDNT